MRFAVTLAIVVLSLFVVPALPTDRRHVPAGDVHRIGVVTWVWLHPSDAGSYRRNARGRSRELAAVACPPRTGTTYSATGNGRLLNGTLALAPCPRDAGLAGAALADAAIGAGLIFGGDQIIIEADAVPEFYGRSIGMAGATMTQLSATNGADPLDVLKCAITTGFDVLPQGVLVPRPGVVDLGNRGAILAGIRAAGLYTAVTLDQRDEDDMLNGRILDLGGARGNPIGGHMLYRFDAPAGTDDDNAPITIVTYGGVIRATMRWRLARAVVSLLLHWEPPVMPAGSDVGVDAGAANVWAAT